MDKIHTKDLVIRQNKQSLRTMDTKFKQLEQQVISLLKLNQLTKQMDKKMKQLEMESETQKNKQEDEFNQCADAIAQSNEQIKALEQKAENYEYKLQRTNDRIEEFQDKLILQSDRLKVMVLDTKSELKVQLKKQEIQFSEISSYNEQLTFNLSSISDKVEKTLATELNSVIEAVKGDNERLVGMEMKVRHLDKI